MPRVVWAGESKNGLGFEIRPSYDATPTRSQCLTDRQSSCSLLSVKWLFVYGSVPTELFLIFQIYFVKTPSVSFYRPLSIGRDLNKGYTRTIFRVLHCIALSLVFWVTCAHFHYTVSTKHIVRDLVTAQQGPLIPEN